MSFSITRESIIADHPIDVVLRRYGHELKTVAGRLTCLCPIHKEKTPSFTVSLEKKVWKCFGCDQGGSVIDLVMKVENLSVAEAMAKLSGEKPAPKPAPLGPKTKGPGEIVKTYDYTNELAEIVYQVVRLQPKSFRQRHQVNGQWVWNMEGIKRVLYRLPKVLKSKMVWVLEGEKDADTINRLGFTGTCNVGGAGKWMDGYTDALKGKEIVLCGDNDEPGRVHMLAVLENIAGKVKSVRMVKVPDPFKDITEYVDSLDGAQVDVVAQSVFKLAEDAAVLKAGLNIPIKSIADLETDYAVQAKSNDAIFNLGNWLPSLSKHVRGITPGEVVSILADTGVGKSMCLQNIAVAARPLATLLFDLELPGELTFERFAALATGNKAAEIYEFYKAGQAAAWRETRKLDHIHVCSESKLTTEKIEQLILKSELVIGERPKLVLVDYVGLITAKGQSRYERLSATAEGLKVVAKSTQTIIVMACQIRRDSDRDEVGLHDAKDSGSVENSSGLVLGAWRDKGGEILKIKILKNTKGRAGAVIDAQINGATMQITEASQFRDVKGVTPNKPYAD